MSSYDLEEQEQLAALKAWWHQNGSILLTVVTAALLALAGWNTWNWYQRSQAVQAAQLFAELQRVAGANDLKKVRDTAGAILEAYPRTTYAAMAALVSAKAHFEANDLKTARVQLQWVMDNARDPEVQTIARLRVASVLLDEKAYDEALKLLEAKHDAAFDARFSELRGDVLVAKGAKAEARSAYKAALDKVPAADNAARELLQLKLDTLGDA